jgi:hypothetical protein
MRCQSAGKNGSDAAVSSFAETNKGLYAIAVEITAYSKKTFEEAPVLSNSCLVQSRLAR